MDLIVVLISVDIIASKFLEAYIASNRLEAFRRERNPLTKFILERTGIENETWFSFFCTILLVGMAVYLLTNFYTATVFQVLYIITGLFTITLNLGAAHTSYFGRKNFITEKLLQEKN